MASRKIFKQDEFRETGFGSKIQGSQRLMNKDGSSNVRRTGGSLLSVSRIYHALITMKWTSFMFYVFLTYLLVNLSFATIYFLMDSNHIGGMVYHSDFEKFMEIFFFSAQSLTTVGYGRLNPMGITDSAIATVESLIGLLSFAIATGLLYARFSRPVANLVFSHNAIVAPYQGATGLMMRLGNKNKNELTDPEASVVMAYIDKGHNIRKFSNLKLELTKVTFLSMTWTLVHPIDEESPLFRWTEDDYKKNKIEILVIIRAFDETFSSNVQSRTSYIADEIVIGAKFLPVVKPNADGSVTIDLEKINDHLTVPLFESISVQTA